MPSYFFYILKFIYNGFPTTILDWITKLDNAVWLEKKSTVHIPMANEVNSINKGNITYMHILIAHSSS